MTDKKIKAVLFDLGETLLSYGKVNTTRLFRESAKLSYKFLKNLCQPVGNFEYYCWRNLISLRIHYWLAWITERDFDTLALLKKLSEKKGIKLKDQQWKELGWLWYEPLSKIAKTESQTKETLSLLKKAGLKLGIVSNTVISGSSLERHLEQLGMLEFFSAKVCSYEFDFRKPDVRIFEAGANQIS